MFCAPVEARGGFLPVSGSSVFVEGFFTARGMYEVQEQGATMHKFKFASHLIDWDASQTFFSRELHALLRLENRCLLPSDVPPQRFRVRACSISLGRPVSSSPQSAGSRLPSVAPHILCGALTPSYTIPGLQTPAG